MRIKIDNKLMKRAFYAWLSFTIPFVIVIKALGSHGVPPYLQDEKSVIFFTLICAAISFGFSLFFGSVKVSFGDKDRP